MDRPASPRPKIGETVIDPVAILRGAGVDHFEAARSNNNRNVIGQKYDRAKSNKAAKRLGNNRRIGARLRERLGHSLLV
jgi:hypothetical protein